MKKVIPKNVDLIGQVIPKNSGIERTFCLVKENRYFIEKSNRYKGIDNVTIHAIEHDTS